MSDVVRVGPFAGRHVRRSLVDAVDHAVAALDARLPNGPPNDPPNGRPNSLPNAPGGTDAELPRRAFLALLARTTGSALAAAYGAALLNACGSQGPDAAQSLLRSAQRRNERVERWLFRHTRMDFAHAALAGTAFPSYHVAPAVPVWNAVADGPWALEVAGLVDRPLRLSLAELQRLPRVSQRVDHFCVEGWNAVAVWHGVRVSDLARAAGARLTGAGAARSVDFRSFDIDTPGREVDDAKAPPPPKLSPTLAALAPTNDTAAGDTTVASRATAAPRASQLLADLRAGRDYHESWDLESALHPQTLVAYGKDGHLLPPAYGAPARLHSPVKLGYKSTKYLTRVVFMPERNGGYWSDQGYEWYAGT